MNLPTSVLRKDILYLGRLLRIFFFTFSLIFILFIFPLALFVYLNIIVWLNFSFYSLDAFFTFLCSFIILCMYFNYLFTEVFSDE
jgi:hypothetical protein